MVNKDEYENHWFHMSKSPKTHNQVK